MRKPEKDPTPSKKDITQKWQAQNLSSWVGWDTRKVGKINQYEGSLRGKKVYYSVSNNASCKLEKVYGKFSARQFILASYLHDKKSAAPPYVQHFIGKLQYQCHDKPPDSFATYHTQVSHLGQKHIQLWEWMIKWKNPDVCLREKNMITWFHQLYSGFTLR